MENSNLHQKLSEIQQKLEVPKSRYNQFGGYYYRSQEDILEAVKKQLPEGLALTLRDNIIQVGDRIYVEATAILGDGKDYVYNQALAREPETKKGMDAAQITGATSSYARKYALNGLFGIDDVQDPDTKDNTQEEKVNNNKQDMEL